MMKLRSKIALSLFCINALYATNNLNDASFLINHVKESIEKAKLEHSKLINGILTMNGMSSVKVRHLLNNLCSLQAARYLEIGVGHGSTLISALYKNTETLADAIAIDNWSEFGFKKNDFLINTFNYLPQKSFRCYEHNAFSLNLKAIFDQPINIYFYDGNHSQESQRLAFTYFNDVLADTFIAIIDDWNWTEGNVPGGKREVQLGTKQAFEQLGYTILYEEILPAYCHPDKANWWNGLYVAVIQK